jgi:hypothetical protein
MIHKIISLFELIIFLCVLASSLVQAQTGIVTGQAVRADNGQPVQDAVIKCKSNPKGERCFITDYSKAPEGNFELTHTPLEWLTVTAKKRIPSENLILVGQSFAYAQQDKSKATEPTPIFLKPQNTTTARIPTPPDQTIIVMASFPLTMPLNFGNQHPDKSVGRSVAGKIFTADNKNPGKIKVIVESDDTDEVVSEIYVRLPDDLSDPAKRKIDFDIVIDKTGDYRLAILADGYYPANYLIVKQDPTVQQSGNTQTVAIPLLVINSDGERVADPATITVTLKPITQQQQEGLGQLINSTEATRRTAFSPFLMQSLPVSGLRSFDSFALLAPGVFPPPQTANTAGPGVSPGVGTAGQFSVNGMRSRENNFTVDGSDNNDEDIGVRRQGFIALVPQSIESLQEFQIITLLADARYGRNAGGQVNVLSKTGNVNSHGIVYGFLADHRLNARDFFVQKDRPSSFTLTRTTDNAVNLLDGQPLVVSSPVRESDPFTRTQTGAAVGGPIPNLRNTFFFTSIEKQIIHATKTSHFAVPTVRQRGILDTGETGVQQPNPGPVMYPASIPGNAIFSLYPFPNNPSGPYGENTYTASLPADGHGLRFSTKIDHQFKGNNKPRQGAWWKGLLTYKSYGDQLTGRYNLTDERSSLPTTGGALFSSLRPKVRTQNVAFFLNRILSASAADTIRFSFGRTRLFFGEVRDPSLLESSALPDQGFLLNAPLLLNLTLPGAAHTTYVSASSPQGMATLNSLGYSGVTQTEQITGPLGQVIIPGFSSIGVDTENFPQERANNTFQIADTITSVKGKNVFTFGTDIRKTHINSSLDRNFRPQAVFNGLLTSPFMTIVRPGGALETPNIVTGTTLAAAGIPTGMFQSISADPNSSIGIRFTQVNLFLQQERRLRSNFRLTWGLRYEVNTVPDTVGHRLENAFDPAALKKQAQEAFNFCNNPPNSRCNDLIGALTAAFPANFRVSFGADRNDFDGRLGFAWSPNWAPTKDGKLSVRVGAGTYSGQFPGIVMDQSRNAFSAFLPLNYANFSPRSPTDNQTFLFNLANPAVQQLLLTINPQLQIIKPGTLNTHSSINPIALLVNSLFNLNNLSINSSPLSLDLVLPQKQLKTPYALHYGITLEYQLKSDYLFSFAFVGTRGLKLLRVTTPDLGVNRSRLDPSLQVTPLTNAAPFPFFLGRELPAQTQIISNAFTIARTVFESSGNSTYNSFQMEVRKRYSQNFQFGSAFTYSHAIDDVSDFFDTAGAFALPQNSRQRSENASAGFDARLRFVNHFVFDLPSKLAVFGGVQLAGILTAQTGQPYTVNSAIDVNHDGNLTDRLNTTAGLIRSGDEHVQLQLAPGTNRASLLAPDGFDGVIGRNTFRAPGVFTCDLAVTKPLLIFHNPRFGESQKLLLRTEVFNLFNRANFGIPVRILEAPGFGTSVNTNSPPRTIQLSLKFLF